MGKEKDSVIIGGLMGGFLIIVSAIYPTMGVIATVATQTTGLGLSLAGSFFENDELKEDAYIYNLAGNISGITAIAWGIGLPRGNKFATYPP